MIQRPLVEISHATIAYNPLRPVFHDISLTIYEREFLGVTGPNGGGKSTLVKAILGLEKLREGTIRFFKDGKTTPKIKIGYLPQRNKIDAQFPISVREVVLSGLEGEKKLWQRFTAAQYERVDKLLEKTGLTNLRNHPVGMLSGGQQQRAFFARAVVSDPDLLILDEPNTYVDRKFEYRIYELLEELSLRSSILLVNHNLNEVVQYARRILFVSHKLEVCPSGVDALKWLQERT